MNSPALPYISYIPGKHFSVFDNPPSSVANWLAVKRNRKHPSFAFDSNGRHWEEIWAVDDHSFGLFARIFNMVRPVDFSFKEAAPIALAEMTRVLCDIIDNDPDDLYDQWMPHNKVKRHLREQKTPAELVWFAQDLGATEFNKRTYGEDPK